MAATKQQSTKSRSGSSRARSNGTAAKPKPRARTAATRAQSSTNGNGNGATTAVKDTAGSAAATAGKVARTVVAPVATAVAAAAAGVVIGRQTRKPRKVLGIKVPSAPRHDLAKSLTEAGKQLGRIANEVRVAREKAEQVGKALT